MQISPYLMFNGNCEEAMTFYEKALGGKLELIRHEGTPAAEHVPPEWRNKILHASLKIGNSSLLASDAPPGNFHPAQGVFVTLYFTDPGEGERVWNALSPDGNVVMAFGETFWASRFGMVIDRFGTPWMINCERASESAASGGKRT